MPAVSNARLQPKTSSVVQLPSHTMNEMVKEYEFEQVKRGRDAGHIVGYRGPLGPVSVTYDDSRLTTRVDGPEIPSGSIEAGPNLQYDGEFNRSNSVEVRGSLGSDRFVARLADRRPSTRQPLEVTADDWFYSVPNLGAFHPRVLVRSDGVELERWPGLLGIMMGRHRAWCVEVNPRDVALLTLLRASQLVTDAWKQPWWAFF